MQTPSPRHTCLAATIAVLAVAAVFGLFALHGGKAEAQGLMSAPACQCSAPTPSLPACPAASCIACAAACPVS